MIKKLQVRFVLMAMSVVLTVLAVIIAGINILNYGSVVREADAVLELLSENEGTFPTGGKMKDHRLPLDTKWLTQSARIVSPVRQSPGLIVFM